MSSVLPAMQNLQIGSPQASQQVRQQKKVTKIGLLTNMCLEGDYRYPKLIDGFQLQKCDALLVNSNCLISPHATKEG